MAAALCANAANDTASVVASAKPAVVTVTTYDAAGKQTGLGTGFFVDDSHVVTCYHVIDGATKAKIKTATGKTYQVKGIAASDRIADVVRLSLTSPVKGAKSLAFSKSLPKQGEKIVVVGTPLGLELTVSDGIVSAIRDTPGFPKLIQITAPISPGSSGSPVLNLNGQVVGVATYFAVKGQNLNFAVASEHVLSLKPSVSALPGAPSSSMDKEMRAGLDCVVGQDYAKALPHFETATRLGPNIPECWFYIGVVYDHLGRYSDAVDACKEAIRIKPDLAEAHCNLGHAYFCLGKYSDAVGAYKQAIRIKPDFAKAHHNLGVAYGQLTRYADAVDAYKEAIRIKPDYAEAHCGLGVAYGQLTHHSDAVDCFKQAIRIKPDYAEAHYNLGIAYGRLTRYADATDAYKQAIRIKPDHVDAHWMLGVTYVALGDKGSALGEYKILQSLDAKLADDLFNRIYK